jgi:hypothetical protein
MFRHRKCNVNLDDLRWDCPDIYCERQQEPGIYRNLRPDKTSSTQMIPSKTPAHISVRGVLHSELKLDLLAAAVDDMTLRQADPTGALRRELPPYPVKRGDEPPTKAA